MVRIAECFNFSLCRRGAGVPTQTYQKVSQNPNQSHKTKETPKKRAPQILTTSLSIPSQNSMAITLHRLLHKIGNTPTQVKVQPSLQSFLCQQIDHCGSCTKDMSKFTLVKKTCPALDFSDIGAKD
ncbi:hypothetical protein V6Z12_D04G135300 [Gossypium hirsutum]